MAVAASKQLFGRATCVYSGNEHANYDGGHRSCKQKWSVGTGVRLRTELRLSRRDGMLRNGTMRIHVVPGTHRHYIETASRKPTAGRMIQATFTEQQEALVKETWSILKPDAGRHAMVLFMKVFEIAPSAKKLFSFLKESDVPLEKNRELKAHALKVFVIICEAATSLRKQGEVLTPGSTMKDMSRSHLMSGVVDEHYEVVKFCMLKTLEEGLPADLWNDDVKAAWGDAYDEVVAAMKAEGQATLPAN